MGYNATYDIGSIFNGVKDILGGVTVGVAKNASDLGDGVALWVFLALIVGIALFAKRGWTGITR